MRSSAWVAILLVACSSPGSSPPGDDDPQIDASTHVDAPPIDPPIDAPPIDPPIDAAPPPIDAPPLVGHPDWAQVQAACGEIRDIAWLGDNELYLACGTNGLVRVTGTTFTTWHAPAGSISKVAVADGEIRALACKTIYRKEPTGWVEDGIAGTLSSCNMGMAGGGGGWFVGTRSFGGNGGFWRNAATGWAVGVDTVRGFEDFIVFSPTQFIANTIGVSTGLNHMKLVSNYWTTQSDFSYAVLSMWRIGTTNSIYFVAGHGNGPNGGKGGIYRWTPGATGAMDAYAFEYDTTGLEWLMGVWGKSPTEVYAVGDSGVLVRSTGNGTWTPMTSGTTEHLEHVWTWNGNVVVASDDVIHVVP